MEEDILESLVSQWTNNGTYSVEFKSLGDKPVKADVKRMSWAEKRAIYTAEDPNEALMREIPKRIFKRGTTTPLLKAKKGDDVVDLLKNHVDPDVTKELLDALIEPEHSVDNTKN